jgi:hypothetical protein
MNEKAKEIDLTPGPLQTMPHAGSVMAVGSPDNLLAMALEKGTDIEQLERLLALKERYDAGEARKAFYVALSQFQATSAPIIKKKDGHNCKYAPLGDIIAQVRGGLALCGLAYRFEIDPAESGITVSCVVTHVDGHSEKTTMTADADDSGSKNEIQAQGSTVSYLQRYTLIGALGITTADEDMDGRLPQESVTEEQVANLEALIGDVGADRKQFLKMLKVDKLADLPAKKYEAAIGRLEDKRKA